MNSAKVLMHGTSFDELKYLYYFKKYFPDVEHRFDFEYKSGFKTEIDIYIPSLNVGIEYDGGHHKYKKIQARDIVKNKNLSEAGIFFIRIRDNRLKSMWKYEFFARPQSSADFKVAFLSTVDLLDKNFQISNKIKDEIKTENFGDDICIIREFYKKILKEKSLLVLNPDVAKQWDYTKNNDLRPEHVTPGSTVEVWWKCDICGYGWLATVHDRSRGYYKCIKCNSLGMKNPGLFKEWHPIKNGSKTLFDYTKGSSELVWWICENNHEYQMTINDKNKNKECGICNKRIFHKDNSLAVQNPKLASEWHPTLNGEKTPEDVFPSSRTERAWWQCTVVETHAWETKIHDRHHTDSGCPYCEGKKVSPENCLQTKRPDIAKYWHPTKNGDLTPADVTVSSGKRVWWQCDCGYEWEAGINNAIRTTNFCPECRM